jgi:DNA-directed RNA polymerase specialized sigma subunit
VDGHRVGRVRDREVGPAVPVEVGHGQFLQEDAQLLTAREKLVISRRYLLNDKNHETETLEQVGRELGLSKERVRQVQMSALGKLRDALLPGNFHGQEG